MCFRTDGTAEGTQFRFTSEGLRYGGAVTGELCRS